MRCAPEGSRAEACALAGPRPEKICWVKAWAGDHPGEIEVEPILQLAFRPIQRRADEVAHAQQGEGEAPERVDGPAGGPKVHRACGRGGAAHTHEISRAGTESARCPLRNRVQEMHDRMRIRVKGNPTIRK